MIKIEFDMKEGLRVEADGKGFEIMAEIPYVIKGIVTCLKEMGLNQKEAEEYAELAFHAGIRINRIEEKDGALDN